MRLRRVESGEFRVEIRRVRFADTFFIHCPVGRVDPTPPKKPSPFGGKVARNAPDEGEMSGSCPLISHLR